MLSINNDIAPAVLGMAAWIRVKRKAFETLSIEVATHDPRINMSFFAIARMAIAPWIK